MVSCVCYYTVDAALPSFKSKDPPHQTLDIALMFYSARLELKRMIFSITFFVRREGGMYLTVLQMECLIAPN